MNQAAWRPLDSALLVAALVVSVASIPVRWLVVAPLLARAVDPFAYSTGPEPVPWLTRLALDGYASWVGVIVSLVLVGAGTVVRVKSSKAAGRTLIAVSALACLGSLSLDLMGVTAAWRADPTSRESHRLCRWIVTDFGVEGVERCACPAPLHTVVPSYCGCNETGLVVVQLVDRNHDSLWDLRCVYEPPCSGTTRCAPACGPLRR